MNEDAPQVLLSSSEPDGSRVDGWCDWPLLAAVAAVGAAVLFIAPIWIVNFDGTSYLALAANLRDLNGYVAPDGSPMLIRGPGYPALLSLGWLFGGYASGLAMAMSRLVLVFGGVAAAQLVFMLARSRLAAIAGTTLFFTQPILYQAGAWQLFPDGLAALLVVTVIVLVLAAERSGGSLFLYVVAGFAASLALATKESHVLVVSGVVLWMLTYGIAASARMRRLGVMGLGFSAGFIPWASYGIAMSGMLPGALPGIRGLGALLAVASVPAVSAALIVLSLRDFRNKTRLPVSVASGAAFAFVLIASTRNGIRSSWLLDGPSAIVELIRVEAYPGWMIVGAAALGMLALIGFAALPRGYERDLLVVTGVAAVGLLVFAAVTGTVIRNAAVMAILVTAVAATAISSLRGRRAAVIGIGALVVVATLSGMGAMGELVRTLDAQRLTAEGEPTVNAARWLEANAPGQALVGTPSAFQSVWRLGDRDPQVSLLPIYITTTRAWTAGDREFDTVYGWLGKPPAPKRTGEAAAYSFDAKNVSAVFLDDIMGALLNNRYVVLTGNTRYPASPADGGTVALALDSLGAVRPVFVEHVDRSQWVAIVEATSSVGAETFSPIVRYIGPRPADAPDPALDLRAYSAAVTELLIEWSADISG